MIENSFKGNAFADQSLVIFTLFVIFANVIFHGKLRLKLRMIVI